LCYATEATAFKQRSSQNRAVVKVSFLASLKNLKPYFQVIINHDCDKFKALKFKGEIFIKLCLL